MIKLEEYKDVTIQQILEVTGLENPYVSITRSLPRQKALLLRDANRNNVLYKIEKSHPITIETKEPFSSTLNLNLISHKVIREMGKIIIEVNKSDIPDHILPNPKPKFSYHVIGILAEEKCYHDGLLYKEHESGYTSIGIKYKFGFHNKVSLHILTKE